MNTDRSVESRFRVRYAETDQMGVVYYANYMVWMEVGRTDFCKRCGFRYRDLEAQEGVAIAVAEVQCRYRKPARYDEPILIRTRLDRLKPRTLTFSYQILNDDTGDLLADGTSTHVAIDTAGRPRRLPSPYFEQLGAWVSGPSGAAELPGPDGT